MIGIDGGGDYWRFRIDGSDSHVHHYHREAERFDNLEETLIEFAQSLINDGWGRSSSE